MQTPNIHGTTQPIPPTVRQTTTHPAQPLLAPGLITAGPQIDGRQPPPPQPEGHLTFGRSAPLTEISQQPESDEALAAQMDTFCREMAASHNFRGGVLVKKGGRTILHQGYGTNRPGAPSQPPPTNQAGTRFCTGSMGKMFTGAAILRLKQAGLLNLDTPINDVVKPEHRDPRWARITVRHLLNHTSGLPCYGSFPADDTRPNPYTLDDLVALVKRQPFGYMDEDIEQFVELPIPVPAFTPGTMHHYSNANYVLLSSIIENVSGQRYEDFMRDQVFGPAGMSSTGMASTYGREGDAIGFRPGLHRLEPQQNIAVHMSKAFAAGGFVTTVEDMAHWDQALFDDDNFLRPETRAELLATEPVIVFEENREYQIGPDGLMKASTEEEAPGVKYHRKRYGLGCDIFETDQDTGRPKIVGHPGAIPGFNAIYRRNLETGDCFIVMGNIDMDRGGMNVWNEVERRLEEMVGASEQ